MTVLLLQLAALLLGALTVGLIVGWQLQRQRSSAQLSALNARANRICRDEGERADQAVADLDTVTRKLAGINADYKQASRRLRNLTGALNDSESTIAGLEAEVSSLKSRLEAADAKNESDQQQAHLSAASHAGEAAGHVEALAENQRQLASLQATLGERESALASLKRLLDARDATINTLSERLAAAERANDEVNRVNAAADNDRLREQLAEARRTAAEHSSEAHAAHAQRQSAETEASQQIAGLQAELSAAHLHARDWEEKYRQLEARADSDDLKRIKGIGPVLEQSLKENGVTSFDQIAAFSDEDIETISSCLQTFPERIRRDRWVEQARRLQGESDDPQAGAARDNRGAPDPG